MELAAKHWERPDEFYRENGAKPMTLPKSGQRFIRNGVEVTVHSADSRQVYGVRYRLPIDDVAVDAALEAGEWPPNCLGPYRVTRAEFERATKP